MIFYSARSIWIAYANLFEVLLKNCEKNNNKTTDTTKAETIKNKQKKKVRKQQQQSIQHSIIFAMIIGLKADWRYSFMEHISITCIMHLLALKLSEAFIPF